MNPTPAQADRDLLPSDVMRSAARWTVAAGLLGFGAGLHGVGVWLAWRPCAGQATDPFSPSCLAAMDGTNPVPLVIEPAGLVLPEILSLGAMVLLAVAWLVVLASIRTGRALRLVLAAPSVLAWGAAAAIATGAAGNALLMAVDVAVGAALLVLFAARSPEPDGHRLRYALVLVGATAMSFGHLVLEYSLAIALSDADWDVPPNTGYLTVAGLVLTAVVVAGWDSIARALAHRGPVPAEVPV